MRTWIVEEPTGTIVVNGEAMPYWLPEGVTPESIGLQQGEIDEPHGSAKREGDQIDEAGGGGLVPDV